jgi:hypothetical protein
MPFAHAKTHIHCSAMQYFGLADRDLPAVRIYHEGHGLAKYRLDNTITYNHLVAFIEKHLAGNTHVSLSNYHDTSDPVSCLFAGQYAVRGIPWGLGRQARQGCHRSQLPQCGSQSQEARSAAALYANHSLPFIMVLFQLFQTLPAKNQRYLSLD